MSAVVATSSRPVGATHPRSRPRQSIFRHHVMRAVICIVVFLVLWEIGSRLNAPWVGEVPAPTLVAEAWLPILRDKGYWYSCYQSSRRVLCGFLAASMLGIP